jgi:hypothetical protein
MQLPIKSEILKPLKAFPIAPSGYDDVICRINELNLEVAYECCDSDGETRTGNIVFDFFVALSIESENNNGVGLPRRSEMLYTFPADDREGFRGFQIWFSNNHLITVVCKRVVIGNEEF